MKRMLLIAAVAVLTSCSAQSRLNSMKESMDKVNRANALKIPKARANRIAEDVKYLSSDDLMGRDTGTKGINLAAYHIQEKFEEARIEPFYDSYRDGFKVEEKDAYNVLGSLTGSDRDLQKEIVIIGAHYDHIGMMQAVAGDSIANGANDNATGTASVLEIARLMKQMDFNRRTVVFALFSAEEKGLLGSKHLAKRMKKEGFDVVAVLNFEMTGTPMIDQPYAAYLTGYDMSNMGDVFNSKSLDGKATGKLEKAAEFNLFKRSDNYPFFQEFNVPAQTFSTFDFTNFDHYHKVGDEFSQVDTDHMAQVVNTLMPGVFEVVNGERLALKEIPTDE